MPVVNCPNCQTTLKVPNGSAAATRCPKCKTVFRPPASLPEFETGEEEPAAPPPPPPKPAAKPSAKPAPAPKAEKPPARQPKKAIPIRRAEAEEDDEDDRPPRRRDDEDEDDRPRKKKKRRPVYEDDEGKPSVGPARTGLTLLSVSLWLYGASIGLLTFLLFLGWVGIGFGHWLYVIAGLVGAANWPVALAGMGFCAAHPKTRGLAVAALGVAVVHLGLLAYDATDTKPRVSESEGRDRPGVAVTGGTGGKLYFHFWGAAMAGYASKFEDKNAGDWLKDAMEASKNWENPSVFWEEFGTMLPVLDALPGELVYYSKHVPFKYYVVPTLVAVAELARLVLILVLVGAVARAGRARHLSDRTTSTIVLVCIIAAACVLVSFAYTLFLGEAQPKERIWFHLGRILFMLTYLAHAGMALISALVTRDARDDVG